MKLEKLNDNQIRCIINRDDLEERELEISELIHRSDKAKELFQDMMQQAATELDFEVNNFPLMVEAAPVSNDCVIFVITRVDNPEDLKNKLPDISNIAHLNIEIHGDESLPFDLEDDLDLFDMDFDEESNLEEDFDEEDELDEEIVEQELDDILMEPSEEKPHITIDMDTESEEEPKEHNKSSEPSFDLLSMFNQTIAKAKKEVAKKRKEEAKQREGIQVYCFEKLNDIIALSAALDPFFDGESHLYKDMVDATYYFVLLQNDGKKEHFLRACTISSDYGHAIDAGYNSLPYFTEHFKAIRIGDAISYLNELN